MFDERDAAAGRTDDMPRPDRGVGIRLLLLVQNDFEPDIRKRGKLDPPGNHGQERLKPRCGGVLTQHSCRPSPRRDRVPLRRRCRREHFRGNRQIDERYHMSDENLAFGHVQPRSLRTNRPEPIQFDTVSVGGAARLLRVFPPTKE